MGSSLMPSKAGSEYFIDKTPRARALFGSRASACSHRWKPAAASLPRNRALPAIALQRRARSSALGLAGRRPGEPLPSIQTS